ncbi:GerAB/ArcD/ProY family transporter [Paenibacillus filicis]|uniref:GerAB/ArcD/ProY family transporter n=1 Tax=Paenibacillus gyeongsangnamensis TaxID=3388067 RepID=A0ABT4Q3J1_9BACL|nr:GerAB/ArcD/ProY family transporter [Paenibacillus filicis]MCZ8511444.1 GerAB/ArcD/ProY family transporter [Paenibacillus filicis]
MNKYNVKQISLFQFIFIIHGAQLTIGNLSLPRRLGETAGTDGWISVILGWVLAMISSFFMIRVMRRHPEDTLFDLALRYLGKWGGMGVAILVLLYYSFAGFAAFFSLLFIIKSWLLLATPTYMVAGLFLIPGYIVIKNGIAMLGRFNEVIFLISIVLPLLLLLVLKEVHFYQLLPVLKEGWGPVIHGVTPTLLCFLGFETAFILYPFLNQKEQAMKGIFIANTLSLIVLLEVTLLTSAYFSPEEIVRYQLPVVSLMKSVQINFIERVDVLYLSAYIMVASVTWMTFMWSAVFGMGKLMPGISRRMHALFHTLLILFISFFYKPSFPESVNINYWWANFGYVIAYSLPPIIYLWMMMTVQYVRRRTRV